jgi:hypothetical protein
VPTLLRLAWPNVLVMLARASTGLIETGSSEARHRRARGHSAGLSGLMLTQMISAGAMGGDIVGDRTGVGRRPAREADALVLRHPHQRRARPATFVMLAFGRPIYRALGAAGGELEAALAYSNVVFAGNVLLWLLNGLASVIRGTGNMLVPAAVICVGVVVLLPLSPLLIFGLGPFPALGIAGGGVAVVAFYAAGTVVLAWYILSGRNVARVRRSPTLDCSGHPRRRRRRRPHLAADQRHHRTRHRARRLTAGAGAAAGYGTGARLNIWCRWYSGSARVVAMVRPISAPGRRAARRAHRRRHRLCGHRGIRIAAALWPHAWLALFSADHR